MFQTPKAIKPKENTCFGAQKDQRKQREQRKQRKQSNLGQQISEIKIMN